MFNFVLMVCAINTVITIGAAIRVMVREDRTSREISKAGNEFLSRWRRG